MSSSISSVSSTWEIGKNANRTWRVQSGLTPTYNYEKTLALRCSGQAVFSPTHDCVAFPTLTATLVARELPHVYTMATGGGGVVARRARSELAWTLRCDHSYFEDELARFARIRRRQAKWEEDRKQKKEGVDVSPQHKEEDGDDADAGEPSVLCCAVSPIGCAETRGRHLIVLETAPGGGQQSSYWDLKHMCEIAHADVQQESSWLQKVDTVLHFGAVTNPMPGLRSMALGFSEDGGHTLVAMNDICNVINNRVVKEIVYSIKACGHISSVTMRDRTIFLCTNSGQMQHFEEGKLIREFDVWKTMHPPRGALSAATYSAPLAISARHVAVGTPTGIQFYEIDDVTKHISESFTFRVLRQPSRVVGLSFHQGDPNLLLYCLHDSSVHILNIVDKSSCLQAQPAELFRNINAKIMYDWDDQISRCAFCPEARDQNEWQGVEPTLAASGSGEGGGDGNASGSGGGEEVRASEYGVLASQITRLIAEFVDTKFTTTRLSNTQAQLFGQESSAAGAGARGRDDGSLLGIEMTMMPEPLRTHRVSSTRHQQQLLRAVGIQEEVDRGVGQEQGQGQGQGQRQPTQANTMHFI